MAEETKSPLFDKITVKFTNIRGPCNKRIEIVRFLFVSEKGFLLKADFAKPRQHDLARWLSLCEREEPENYAFLDFGNGYIHRNYTMDCFCFGIGGRGTRCKLTVRLPASLVIPALRAALAEDEARGRWIRA